jgi:hypothetical protein
MRLKLALLFSMSVLLCFVAPRVVADETKTSPATAQAQADPAPKPGDAERATAFELEDQHRTKHTFSVPPTKVTIILFADRKGADQLDGWIKPLDAKYGKSIDLLGVAELSIVPGAFHGLARYKFRQKMKSPVMLDWDGSVSKAYKIEADVANAIVIDTAGAVRLRVSGAADESKLKQVDVLLTELNVSQNPTPPEKVAK